MKKIYISGPMTGIEDFNREAFMKAEWNLMEMGYSQEEIVNPARFPFREDGDYNIMLEICLAMMRDCKTIYMLDGWEESKGACMELGFALAKGMEVIYAD